MMNRHESKYFNTAYLFDEALISLLSYKNLEYITVKEICNKAKVNRSTFYLHYDTIYDLLNETTEYIINKFISCFNCDIDIDSTDKIQLNFINRKYLTPYLEFIKSNKNIFLISFKDPLAFKSREIYSRLESNIFNPILDRYGIPDNKKKYYLEFYINGIMGIIKEWLYNDCIDDINYIINIIIECIKY